MNRTGTDSTVQKEAPSPCVHDTWWERGKVGGISMQSLAWSSQSWWVWASSLRNTLGYTPYCFGEVEPQLRQNSSHLPFPVPTTGGEVHPPHSFARIRSPTTPTPHPPPSPVYSYFPSPEPICSVWESPRSPSSFLQPRGMGLVSVTASHVPVASEGSSLRGPAHLSWTLSSSPSASFFFSSPTEPPARSYSAV